MKALVYQGPGLRGWDTVDDPTIIDPTDIIVRIDTSSSCGSDLHILKGDVPETTPGTVLGHEAVGIAQEIGANVSTVGIGDRARRHVHDSEADEAGLQRSPRSGDLRHAPIRGHDAARLVAGTA